MLSNDETSTDEPYSTVTESSEARVAAAPVSIQWGSSGVIAYYCGLLLLEFMLILMMRLTASEPIALITIGLVVGHVVFVLTAGSFMGENWLEGVLLSGVGILGIIVACTLPEGIRMATVPMAFLPLLFSLPAMCLIASLPLLIVRWWFGWRLASGSTAAPTRSRLSIEDLILVPSAVVTLFVAANFTTGHSDETFIRPSGWYFTGAVPGTILSLLIVLPIVFWFFRKDDVVMAWFASGGYVFAWTFVCIFIVAIMSNGRIPPQLLSWLIGTTAIASLVALAGLHVLRATGFRLICYASAGASDQLSANTKTIVEEMPSASTPIVVDFAADVDVVESSRGFDSQGQSAKKDRARFRVAVGVLVAVTAFVNAMGWTIAKRRLDSQIAKIKADGGIVEYSGGELVGIDFGPHNLARNFDNLPTINSVRYVKLNRIAATDFWFWRLRKFPSLRLLDIRNIPIEPNTLSGFVPTRVRIVTWSDQFDSEQFEEFKKLGYTIERVER